MSVRLPLISSLTVVATLALMTGAAQAADLVGGTLTVTGASTLNQTSINGILTLRGVGTSTVQTTDASGLYLDAKTSGGMYLQSDGNFYFRKSSTPFTERMRIDAAGNVGIGTGTAALTSKLEVQGGIRTRNPSNAQQRSDFTVGADGHAKLVAYDDSAGQYKNMYMDTAECIFRNPGTSDGSEASIGAGAIRLDKNAITGLFLKNNHVEKWRVVNRSDLGDSFEISAATGSKQALSINQNGETTIWGKTTIDSMTSIVGRYPSVSGSTTTNLRGLGIWAYELPIASGVTDNGYRVGLQIDSYFQDPLFQGTLNDQKAIWARNGAYGATTGGRINNSYGVYIDSLTNTGTTITNLFGLYQASSAAKNYFAGNVGIGTEAPYSRLHVVGASGLTYGNFNGYSGTTVNAANLGSGSNSIVAPNNIMPQLFVNAGSYTGTAIPQLSYRGGIALGAGVGMYSLNPNPAGSPFYGDIRFYNTVWNGSDYNVVDRLVINMNGNVGIGTSGPVATLDIQGNVPSDIPPSGRVFIGGGLIASNTIKNYGMIYTKGIRVMSTQPFPDYVFSDAYSLRTLDEVEAAIKQDKRLPGMISAADVAKDGLPLGDVVTKQMEKIEELTLYAIEAHKKNKALEQKSSALERENAALQSRLAAIEAALGIKAITASASEATVTP